MLNLRIRSIASTAAIALALCAGLSSCDKETTSDNSHTASSDSVVREQQRYISENYASFRKRQIDNIVYHFAIDLTDREQFHGTTTIDFDLVKEGDDVSLDFYAGDINTITVNGTPLKSTYEKWFINLPAANFKLGRNTVVVDYRRPYVTDGAGLNQYQDPESGNYYLYTQFEPYEANKFAPVFDQPNLKAEASLTVTAPKEWNVITTTRETEIESLPDARRWHFPTSAKLPTYVFSLHAGPYTVWEDDYALVPLRLFARREIANQIDPTYWFQVTRDSFAFFNAYYDFPYPFQKYDQLIVPNFNFGAMENVGAVTFSEERFGSDADPSPQDKFRLASVIAHEMAHMWFGNVVTMDWWNGLWLNESFATLMANKAMEANPQYGDAALAFLSFKNRGYYADQLVTTHPIDMAVSHPGEVFGLIDEISYAKGAAVLKQLTHLAGSEKFREAIAYYIAKNQYSNTRLTDFTDAIAEKTGLDMSTWTVQWLYTPGVNTIEPTFECDEGKLVSLSLLQTAPPQWPQLRTQKVQLGLFDTQANGTLKLIHTLPVVYEGASTAVDLTAEPVGCPDFVYANYEEWGYVKLALDETSMAALMQTGIGGFSDEHMRSAIWQILGDMVNSLRLPLTDYVNFLVANLPAETSFENLTFLMEPATHAFNDLEAMPPSDASRAALAALENVAWRQFNAAPEESLRRRALFELVTVTTHTGARLDALKNLIAAKPPARGAQTIQWLRWQAIQQLSRYNVKGYQALIDTELDRDTSETGRQASLLARAIAPTKSAKKPWVEALLDPDSTVTLSEMRAVWENLYPGKQRAMLAETGTDILAALPAISEQREAIFLSKLAEKFIPVGCRASSVNALESAIQNKAEYAPAVVRALRIRHQEDARCVAKTALVPAA
ncbi:aminopeptidase N [Teredinibacter turnerae]|uniref:aminopeptidase N n=1 Tax=Teredinibacter turnerae TaxID=2426 RepID=UPI0005F7A9E5|nr:aminopeptidase N [Teredinibacter turnerae]